LRKHKGELGNLNYKEKFSSLYSSIDTDKKGAILLTTLFLFRRLSLALTLIFIIHGQALQVLLTDLVSLSLVGYLICYLPMIDTFYNLLELYNELTMLSVTLLLTCLTNYTYCEDQTRLKEIRE
jgi:hypothetical protein